MIRIDRVLQALLGLVLFAAGIFKILDPHAFAVSVARVAPMAAVGPVAILLPWLEVVTAVALFVPRYRDAALKLSMALLAVFTTVLLFALIRGTAHSCGCFGSGDGVLQRADVAVVRNLILLAMAGFLIRRKTTSREGPASPA